MILESDLCLLSQYMRSIWNQNNFENEEYMMHSFPIINKKSILI